MSHIPPPKEQSGCIQTLIISRMILQILFVPLMMILGTIVAILIALYAVAEHPLYGLAVILIGGAVIALLARWEYHRVGKEIPPEDR